MRDSDAQAAQTGEDESISGAWLFVDLDQSLLRTDLLWEGMVTLLRSSPFQWLALPFWLLGGRASFKQRLARVISFDPTDLPYRSRVLDHIQSARSQGRKVVLASASPRVWVQAVSDHLGCFDAVLASEGDQNLKGKEKLDAILSFCGGDPFEYVGDSSADIPIWKASSKATLVCPRPGLEKALSPGPPVKVISDPPGESRAGALLRELRPVQWVKNVLVFVPLLLAQDWGDAWRLMAAIWAFVGFCVVASAGYVVNDLIDLKNDRAHAEKRFRPIASGVLPVSWAIFLVVALGAVFAVLANFWLGPATTGMLAFYLVLTLSYSFYFKKRLLLDTLMLAGLYGYRLATGGVASDVVISPWLLVFSSFLFLSLALVKRYSELRLLPDSHDEEIKGRAYTRSDLPGVQGLGQACGMMSILVLCLYVGSEDVARLYETPLFLWGIVPVMFYWISRVWMMAWRDQLPGDPVLFAVRDRVSYVCGACLVGFVALAAFL